MPNQTRLLIFVVAYNAEKHIESVLDRIPKLHLSKYDYEILIIDDQSKDATFEKALFHSALQNGFQRLLKGNSFRKEMPDSNYSTKGSLTELYST